MTINAGLLADATKGFRAVFLEELSRQIVLVHPQICTIFPSSGSQEDYSWLEDLPAVKEWLDERQIEELAAARYQLLNKKWESTIRVKRTDIEDDKLGLYAPLIKSMAQEHQFHYEKLVADLLNNGFSGLAYDGKAFFADDHAIAGTTYDNLETHALSADYFAAALAVLQTIKKKNGVPFCAGGQIKLIVPPALRSTGFGIVGAEYLANGANNPNFKAAELVVWPWLTSATAWFLVIAGLAVGPFALQKRVEVEFDALDDPSKTDSVFMRDSFLYGTRSRDNAGYLLWQLAFGSTGAV